MTEHMTKEERRAYIIEAMEFADSAFIGDGAWIGYITVEKGIDVSELPNWDEAKKEYVWP